MIYELLYTVINYGHLKETVKTNSNSEKDGPGSVVSAVVSVGEAPHRYDKIVFRFSEISLCQEIITKMNKNQFTLMNS